MIYVVTGHARSGTSMMMAALKAGGMPIAASATRERFNWMDGPYRPNRGGLHELELTDMQQPGWAREHEGRALKCLAGWLRHLSVNPTGYRVAFMHRDPEEIRQSLRAAFGLETTLERIEAELAEALKALENRKDVRDITHLTYTRVLEDPVGAFRLLEDLGWPLDAREAAKVVDPVEYRFQRAQLVEGLLR